MRWISFFILAYLGLGLQTGISAAMATHGAGPNLVLIMVVFIAMNAPRDAALMGAFLLGFMQDLCAQGPMGLYAFSYGIVAMFVGASKQALHREHPLTHFTLTLMGGIIAGIILLARSYLHRPALSVAPLFYTALYSAILAPVLLGILQRLAVAFRFQTPRRRMYAQRG